MTKGFLVVDKPKGMTSNQAVGAARKATGVKKVGHAGTLDPMATGVLVLAIGKVTRLIKYVQDQAKEYVATALFGVATDTLDAEGAVLSRDPLEIDEADVEALVPRFMGTISQVPPMVSALKRGGRRLYELAREGQVVEREARQVEIHELEILSVGAPPYPEVEFRVVCGKGTYVRSLADDMAAVLGGQAHLTALRRTRIGDFGIRDSVTVEDLGNWESYLISPAHALSSLPSVVVDDETARGVRHGMRFVGGPLLSGPDNDPYAVLTDGGELIAVYSREGEGAVPEVVLPS
ncbi:MAG TPA: tRNA pseudouridine(55) synthase TruB [Acidimicrobiia bacterium]|nr:tRNA pseudouridine(55) synthase TruB [Acidimicrobiia bacterium]